MASCISSVSKGSISKPPFPAVSSRQPPLEVITGTPEDSLESVMELMTEKRFRHLPVLEQGSPVGMVSIGDVVKALNTAAEYENRQLKDYIAGGYA